jgi:uncharacterized membrane protein YgdD (TMEM256/DUF423 family)
MRGWLIIAALLGVTGVAAGAMGAHALGAWVSPERVRIWETGAQYHLVHAVVLLLLSLLSEARLGRWLGWARAAFLTGVILFSFSLYALVLLDQSVFARVTPVGGLSLMVGWMLLGISAWHSRDTG